MRHLLAFGLTLALSAVCIFALIGASDAICGTVKIGPELREYFERDDIACRDKVAVLRQVLNGDSNPLLLGTGGVR